MNPAPRCWRAHSLLSSSLGLLSIVALLALTPTGVHVARAADPAPLVPEAVGPSSVDPALQAGTPPALGANAPVCRGGTPEVAQLRTRAQLRQEMLRAQQEIARLAARKPGSGRSADDVIVLNGRGYRYGP